MCLYLKFNNPVFGPYEIPQARRGFCVTCWIRFWKSSSSLSKAYLLNFVCGVPNSSLSHWLARLQCQSWHQCHTRNRKAVQEVFVVLILQACCLMMVVPASVHCQLNPGAYRKLLPVALMICIEVKRNKDSISIISCGFLHWQQTAPPPWSSQEMFDSYSHK